MKTFIPVPVMVSSSRARGIRQPRAVQVKMAHRRSWLSRFRRFIETTNWEERLCGRWIDSLCLGGIVAALFYFVLAWLSPIL